MVLSPPILILLQFKHDFYHSPVFQELFHNNHCNQIQNSVNFVNFCAAGENLKHFVMESPQQAGIFWRFPKYIVKGQRVIFHSAPQPSKEDCFLTPKSLYTSRFFNYSLPSILLFGHSRYIVVVVGPPRPPRP